MRYPSWTFTQHFGWVSALCSPSNWPGSPKCENASLWLLAWPWTDKTPTLKYQAWLTYILIRAFKCRLARLATTTTQDSYWRLGMPTRSALVCPGSSFLFYSTPTWFKKLPIDFHFPFFRRCAVHFPAVAKKLVKIKRFVCLISTKNLRGG